MLNVNDIFDTAEDGTKIINKDKIMEIVTTDHTHYEVLIQKTQKIEENELPLAREMAALLFESLQPYLPAAGLAAPQIGISKSIFIYSYNRDPKNLEVVINPEFTPIGNEMIEEWEACFSTVLSQHDIQIAKLKRYAKIKVNYLNLEGQKIEAVLEGFAAKAFQHEYDHLQGIINIHKPGSIVKRFDSREELDAFIEGMKKQDSKRY